MNFEINDLDRIFLCDRLSSEEKIVAVYIARFQSFERAEGRLNNPGIHEISDATNLSIAKVKIILGELLVKEFLSIHIPYRLKDGRKISL